MKKLVALATIAVLMFALTGCVVQVTKEGKSSMAASDVSASASASSSAASGSSSAASNWTSTVSAEDAAKGAGISSFGVPVRTVIADFVFTNPQFAYTEHVAQATYEVTGSAKLIVRKAEGAHTASITDRQQSEFSQSWKNTYEGYEVTSFGNTQGEAVICVWNDGTKEYGVTIAGLGNSNVTMDAEDVDDIVTAVKAAENPQPSSASGQASDAKAPGFDVSSIVKNAGLGEFLRYYYTTGANGVGYWAIVTRGADGGEYITYVDTNGTVVQGGPQMDYDGADFNVEQLVANNGLGQFKRYYWIKGENGQGYWGIVTIGADGAEHTTYTDEAGNIIQGGVEVGSIPDTANNGAAFSVEELVTSNGLGEFQHYYWIQGSGDTGYWVIITRGADGAEYATYVDEAGNIIQSGI